MTLVGLGKLRSVNAQVLLPIGDGAFFNGDPEFGFSKRENGETYQMLPLDRGDSGKADRGSIHAGCGKFLPGLWQTEEANELVGRLS